MASKIYEVRKGVKRELTTHEIKQRVMAQRGWDNKQYNKEYDKMRNRLRAYEAYQMARGKVIERQSPATILYRESRAMKREGQDYKPSKEMQRLKQFPTISSGKKLDKALEENIQKFDKIYGQNQKKIYGGLIAKNGKAYEIWIKLKDNPVKREQVMREFLDKLHTSIEEFEKTKGTSAIPFGVAVGSGTAIDFNVDDYLKSEEKEE